MIDHHSKYICDQDITLEEIHKSVEKLKNNKAPGNYGLTCEFYKEFKEDISEFLLYVFKEILQNEVMLPTMLQGLITLIPKPGKDLLNIENWRPITLINNDTKLLSHIFASRLKLVLNEIIDDCQSGFLCGRYIGNNIRLILDLIDYNFLLTDDSYIFL